MFCDYLFYEEGATFLRLLPLGIFAKVLISLL